MVVEGHGSIRKVSEPSENDGQRQKNHVSENEKEGGSGDGALREKQIAQRHDQDPSNAKDSVDG
jgi:hypothetical protein